MSNKYLTKVSDVASLLVAASALDKNEVRLKTKRDYNSNKLVLFLFVFCVCLFGFCLLVRGSEQFTFKLLGLCQQD